MPGFQAKISTPERDAYLRKACSTFTTDEEILETLNAMPGPPMTWTQVGRRLKNLQIKRPKWNKFSLGLEVRHDPLAYKYMPDSVKEQREKPHWTEDEAPEFIEMDAVLKWARHNCPQAKTLDEINAFRRENNLPRWHLKTRSVDMRLQRVA